MNTTNPLPIMVRYNGDGKHIKAHQMNSIYVADSIKALATVYQEAYLEANKIYKSKVNLESYLEGGFGEGSIWWIFKLFTSENESQQSLDKQNISTKIFSSIEHVIRLLKQIDLSTTEIVIKDTSDGYKININGELVYLDELKCALLTNPKVRAALSSMAMPLSDEGISSLTVNQGEDEKNTIKIIKGEEQNLIVSRNHKHIIDDGKITGFYHIDTLSYNPKSKWILLEKDYPKNSITVLIVDPKFLKNVSENQEKFSKDDLLEVEGVWFKEKRKLTGKVSVTYTITKVIQHIPAEDRQWKLL